MRYKTYVIVTVLLSLVCFILGCGGGGSSSGGGTFVDTVLVKRKLVESLGRTFSLISGLQR
jgi:hypothetical protein